MHLAPNLLAPGLKRITGFWLTALMLGSIPIFSYYILSSRQLDYSLLLTTAIAIFTAALSLPSLLFLFLLIPWAFARPSYIQRWLCLVVAQSISASVAFGLIYCTILNNHVDNTAPLIAISYFLSGLVAAYWRYSAWLTRSI
jgi:hypothetical protein